MIFHFQFTYKSKVLGTHNISRKKSLWKLCFFSGFDAYMEIKSPFLLSFIFRILIIK